MPNEQPKHQDISRFPRLPSDADEQAQRSSVEKILLSAIAAGGGVYFLLPELLGYGHAGNADESSALLAAIAAAIFTSIKSVPALCHGAKETQEEMALNYAKGTLGGLALGLSIASVTAAALVSFIDGGIILGTVLGGGAGAHIKSKVRKTKRCPHCGKKGKCSQRICRYCYKIFFPKDKPVDCRQTKVLDWYHTSSYLQQQGLSYLDTEELAKKHASKWGFIKSSKDFVILCHEFISWVNDHIGEIVSSRGSGLKAFNDEREIERYLDNIEGDA